MGRTDDAADEGGVRDDDDLQYRYHGGDSSCYYYSSRLPRMKNDLSYRNKEDKDDLVGDLGGDLVHDDDGGTCCSHELVAWLSTMT